MNFQWIFDADYSTQYVEWSNPKNEVTTIDEKIESVNLQWIFDADHSTQYVEWFNPKNEVTATHNSITCLEYRRDEDILNWYLSIMYKSFILSKGEYKKWYKGSSEIQPSWQLVSTTLPTETQFQEEGMSDLSVIPKEAWKELLVDTTIQLVKYTEVEESQPIIVNAIPNDQLVYPTKDINIRSIENIDSVKLTATALGNGMVRIIVSFNSGATWYAHNGTEWIEVSPIVDEVITKGMTPKLLAGVTSVQWAKLRGTCDTMRFAYALSIKDTSDVAEIDALITQMDMKGTWKKAVHGKDYDYEYPNNDELLVTIFSNGDYKINY
ncbi:hypothetical protein ACQKMD_16715 [Viridibacillus sp. NPDC096237]|uniref:hypothetical protein n=1 Tax=Viridibacillus sp. NPDC096237 TaxID=3390721 RepID=UPI003D003B80